MVRMARKCRPILGFFFFFSIMIIIYDMYLPCIFRKFLTAKYQNMFLTYKKIDALVLSCFIFHHYFTTVGLFFYFYPLFALFALEFSLDFHVDKVAFYLNV